MAKLEEVLSALRAGRKIRREQWSDNYVFFAEELLADDWEIVGDEPKTDPLITDGQTRYQWMTDGSTQPIGSCTSAQPPIVIKEDRRGLYAAMAMQGILATSKKVGSKDEVDSEDVAELAVKYADALIARLEQ